MDWNKVDAQIAEKFITCRKHPAADLWIYNYTQRAQWDNHWTPETRACRGLIADANRNIVARPFEKFFNIEQHDSLPAEHFDVYEKLDGSLGVMYFLDGKPQIATRGSFDSPQAAEANRILAEKYGDVQFYPSLTYLVEILYPENRIVVNYGDRRDLVLLAVIETATGKEWPLTHCAAAFDASSRIRSTSAGGLPLVRCVPGRHGVDGLDYLRAMNNPNEEGFVIRFQSGLRVKIKFSDYKRLHKILTGVNERHIWEHLRGGSFDAMLDHVPDEFMSWARGVEADLRGKYAAIERRCMEDFRVLADRKQTALHFKSCPHPSVLFNMLDGKPYSDTIWKMVEPAAGRTFKVDLES